LAGTAVVSRFHWVMYVLGAFLVYTGAKILLQKEEDLDPGHNPLLRTFRRLIPTATDYEGERFTVRRGGRLLATPLLVVLVVIDVADVMFAIDSIPAVLGITTDVFIVFTSNIFAILGLRSLFFLIEALVRKLRFLKVGVALILAFIGVKILIEPWYHMPIGLSLGVLGGVLGLSTVASLMFPAPSAAAEEQAVSPSGDGSEPRGG
jgi:tellurite resistance protein TerC